MRMPLIRFKALILSLVATLLLFEVSIAQNKISADGSWSKVDESEYAASYPSKWKLDQSGIVGTKFVISDSELIGGFRANTTLLIQDVTGSGIDLGRYFELSESKLKSAITNAEVVYSKRITASGKECQEFVFKGDQGIFHLKWRQRYWVKGNRAYVLTFTASQAVFDDYTLVADKIFNLFAFK
jgi:serine/threonine-protein kinase